MAASTSNGSSNRIVLKANSCVEDIKTTGKMDNSPPVSISSSSIDKGHCLNCRNPFTNTPSSEVTGQGNTKLFVFKTTQGCFKQVSIISVVDAMSYIYGERFNPKDMIMDPGNSTNPDDSSSNPSSPKEDEIELPLCTRCGDLVQCIYNLHKEFQEICHAESRFQSLFPSMDSNNGDGCEDPKAQNSTNNSEDETEDGDDMIVPGVIYDEKQSDDDETSQQHEDENEVQIIEIIDPNPSVRVTRKRGRKSPPEQELPPRRKIKCVTVEILKPQQTKNLKPKVSLASILEKLKEKRLLSKTRVEMAAEKLEWKRRRFENSLHLFRIKLGKKKSIAGAEMVEKYSKLRQTRPKMKANDIIPLIQCPDCGKTCNKRFLEAHRNVMHRKVPAFVCNICGRVNRDFENLKLHLSTHSVKPARPVLVKEKRSARCLLCRRMFRRSVLDLHVAIHGIPRKFNCKKCDSRFENSTDLKDHQIIHEEGGYYAFKCDSCNEGFKIESFLINHHKFCELRAVDRPYICTFCEKRFKLKHHLESHLFEVHKLSKEESRGMVYPGLAKRTVNRKRK